MTDQKTNPFLLLLCQNYRKHVPKPKEKKNKNKKKDITEVASTEFEI